MSYNSLLTAENLEQLQLQTAEAQKLLASQVAGINDIIPALLNTNYELGGNINMLPSPETDSLVSSPSISNPDDELELFNLQPSVHEQEQLLSGIPVGTVSLSSLDQVAYENALMSILANNQVQPSLPLVNDESLLLNYPGMLPLKSQSPIMDPLDLTNTQLNDIPVETLDQLLNQPANMEIPSLVPSTVEPTVGTEMIDPLLGASNPYLMNELLEANALISATKMNKMGLNNYTAPTFEQVSTPPLSPVDIEGLAKAEILNNVSVPSTQPIVLKSMTPSVPSQKGLPVLPQTTVPTQMYAPELDVKKVQPVPVTKTSYTYMPVTKKRSNSDLKGVKLERRSSGKNQKKSVPMVKDKTSKTIQKQQIRHTFVIETPGINYGKKTSGRKRKCKKNDEEDTITNIPQVPQIPCRPSVSSIPPQKLSKIHARTTEDLDSLPFQCEFCPSAFSRKHDLKRHIKIHTGSTPAHKCKHCGKSYARAEALAKHEAGKECQK